MNEDELNTRILSMGLNVHQSSISHAIRDLTDEDLVTKTNHGYRLTNLGWLMMHLMDFQEKALESFEHNKDFILTHDICGIPMVHLIHIDMICNQREEFIFDASTPYRNQEDLTERLNNCRELRCVLSVVALDNLESISNTLKNKTYVEIIMSDNVLQNLRKHYPHILKKIVGYDNLKIYRVRDANFNLFVTESSLFLRLRRVDGSYDLENLIFCKTDIGLDWGNTLFEHYRRNAKVVDTLPSYS